MKEKIFINIISFILLISILTLVVVPISAEIEADASEKIYSNATIEDDFAPDTLLVVLNNKTSLKFKTYSSSDFGEINAKNVRHITAFSESRAKKAGAGFVHIYKSRARA